MKKTAALAASILFITLLMLSSGCKANLSAPPTSSAMAAMQSLPASMSPSPASTTAPGEYPLSAIIEAAEKHLDINGFAEIPETELRANYKILFDMGVEVRGRRLDAEIEYVVYKAIPKIRLDDNDIKMLDKRLQESLKARADIKGMKMYVGAESSYGVVVVSRGDPAEIADAVRNSWAGQYIHEMYQ